MSFRFLLVSVRIINVGLRDSMSLVRTDPLANLALGSPPMLHCKLVMWLPTVTDVLIQ